MLHALLNPSIFAITALALSIVWMLRDEKDKTRAMLVIALVVNMFYGFLLSTVMGKENGLVPWKYDYILADLDRALGLSGTRLSLALQGAVRMPLVIVYQTLVPMMVAWFLVARARRAPGSIVIAYVAEMVVGPILYAVVPACGPVYAFRAKWLAPPPVAPGLVRFDGMPNAFPSLHVATALIFVLYAPTARWRLVALTFLTATAAATLATGEHYVIDLVTGLAFGCFAANVGRRHIARASAFLGIIVLWTLAVRFAYMGLLAHPWLLRGFALVTVLASAAGVLLEWRDNSWPDSNDQSAMATAPAAV